MGRILIILIMFLPQLVTALGEDSLSQSSSSLIEVGIRGHLPILGPFLKNSGFFKEMGGVKSLYTGGDFLGLYLTLGVNFTKNLNFEFRGGRALNRLPRLDDDGYTTAFESVLKRFSRNRKLYGAISFGASRYDMSFRSLLPTTSFGVVSKDRWKELIGIGFGVSLWKNLYLEMLCQFPLGDKVLYEEYWLSPNSNEPLKVRSIVLELFIKMSIGYSWGIVRRD